MSLKTGIHTMGPENSTLWVRTGRTGAIAKAGHDLSIEVTAWSATIETGADGVAPRLSLTADAKSLRVRDGKGGVQALGDEEKDAIRQTIDDEVLEGTPIEFRSTSVQTSADGRTMDVQGELQMFGHRRPVSFTLTWDGNRVTGVATIKQTDWGRKPYSALFGTLKVADAVKVELDGHLDRQ
jgi:polyisoprenoid-binding protein YceI